VYRHSNQLPHLSEYCESVKLVAVFLTVLVIMTGHVALQSQHITAHAQ